MYVQKFHKIMKQHCNRVKGDCRKCCFVDYCYSQKRDINEDFLTEIISQLSNLSDTDKDIFVPVIHNRHNVCRPEENNENK